MADHVGEGGFDADARELTDLPGQGGDHVLGGVDGDADDVDAPLAVGNAHAADDVLAVVVEDGVDGLHAVAVLHDDGHDGHSGFHEIPPWKLGILGVGGRPTQMPPSDECCVKHPPYGMTVNSARLCYKFTIW